MEGLIVRVPTGLDVLVRLKGLPARELEIDFVLPQLEVKGGGVKGKVHVFIEIEIELELGRVCMLGGSVDGGWWRAECNVC